MAKLYGDENFPLPVVHELSQFGHDSKRPEKVNKVCLMKPF